MPTTIEALVIIALVISPGFVSATLASGVIAFSREPGDLRFLLPTITYGTVVHIALSAWTFRIIDYYNASNLTNHPLELVLWGIALIFVAPACLGMLIWWLLKNPRVDGILDKFGLGYIDRTPSAWDYVVRLERPSFVRAHLSDGSLVGGAFYAGSFASTNPGQTDLYLEKAWQLDDAGNFKDPLVDSQGVWIASDAMAFVEFFSEGNKESQQNENEDGIEQSGQADAPSGQRQTGDPAKGSVAAKSKAAEANASGE